MGISRLYIAGTPFNGSELADIDFEQSADVMYITHIDHPLGKFTRYGNTDWRWTDVTFGPTVAAPGTVTASYTNGQTADNYPTNIYYGVTAISTTGQEGRMTQTTSPVFADLSLRGNIVNVVWDAVPNAEYYYVYKQDNDGSSFGYIGRAEGTTFTDSGSVGQIAPEYSVGPPKFQNPFDGVGNYPSTVTFHEQRLMLGRTRNKLNGVWGSQSADYENMDVSLPVKADDAISFGLVGKRVNAVNQLASMKNLLALTSDAAFAIFGGSNDDALSPTNIVSRNQAGRGSSRLNPIIIDSVAFFRPSQGSSIRTIGYTFELDGYQSNNVAIFSPHFFDGFTIIDWAYQQEPYSCVWAVRNDGVLLCLTWEQEQQVWGWTMCEIEGTVEAVCSITENGMDRIYLAVRRTLAGQEDVFIERMALPLLVASDLSKACHLDCAVSQVFDPPRATVSGLWHLEGETVSAFHDGYVTSGLVVQNGSVTLPGAATIATVGIPYVGEIETLPLPLTGANGTAHVSRQIQATATIRVQNTRGITAGPGGGSLFEIKQRQGEALGDPIALTTGDFEVKLAPKWSNGATVRVQQTYPLPCTINGIFPDTIVTD